ncbi:MAG: hypothetical protein KJ556_06970 [Gammaproteobacteria bacterium]|nr:hypothetical protein [Gammaproteobacteria bacterium]MBU2057249.1 hypothetical protein [Gammaproteobacteria bacterium]MBU2174851.1 hypothetical protein [Gammaproteobacteria bacterium]MBU2245456.1 hypothetical protein [Gammaproteobacteria bacterium]MBU2344236.1 hypothetical protein [Gammaproteobacteria bacterium]
MESWISSGLIGGCVAVVIGVIFTNAVRKTATSGELKHGLLILTLALACFAEYFKVKGRFDSDDIAFHTLWTGTKKENWDDLVSAKFNASMYWYRLKFRSGKKVRLSSYVLGHGEVLTILKERGYDF